jgi:hypothetical protein
MAKIDLYCNYKVLPCPIQGWYLKKAINVKPEYYMNGFELEEGDLMLGYLNNPSFIFPFNKPEDKIDMEDYLSKADFHAVIKLGFDISKQLESSFDTALDFSKSIIDFLYNHLYNYD